MQKSEIIYNEILDWLESKRNTKIGLKLHSKYSKNPSKKRRLALKPILRKKLLPVYLKEILKRHKPINTVLQKKEVEKKKEVSKSILDKLKKDFSKIEFNLLPETLKKLVFIRYDNWDTSLKQYALQHAADNKVDRFNAGKSTILSIQTNWLIWDELNHFHN